MKNPNTPYFKTLETAFVVALVIVLITITCSSCKLLSKVGKAKSDSTTVIKQSETIAKVDTSKSKTETIHTKETVYQPQPIYIQGKDGETKVIFVPQSTREVGSVKTEDNTAKFEQMKKDFSDSLAVIKSAKQSETKAGTDWLQIAILGALGLVLIKNFAPNILSLIKK